MSTESNLEIDDSEVGSCPHLGVLDKTRFNRLFSRVAALRASGAEDSGEYPDIFEFTHHPITVFEQSFGENSADPRPVQEDDIIDEFDPDALNNFTVVIEGPVGTGKSELCAYLTHALRTDHDRPVLRVDKDSDLLTMLTETVPEFYEREIGEPLEVSGNLEELARELESNPEIAAGVVVSNGLKLLEADYDLIELDKEQKNAVEDFILEKLNELVERRHQDDGDVEDEREGFRFVTKQDYTSGHEEHLEVFAEAEPDPEKEPYELLNDKFWSALLDNYDSPPLNSLLKQVGQAFDTRPVCVFEDFSIAAVQAEKLRNYMERDNDKDNWDFIIAGTTDYTRELKRQTSQDRFKFYQTNRPGSKQVEFLTEDSVADFVRPYLAYPKSRDDSIRYRNSKGDKKELIDPPEGSVCGECRVCSNDFRDFFPFNETFIERLYNPGLNEDDRRPRSIVTIVSDILEEFTYGPTSVPSDAQALRNEVNSPDTLVADDVLERSETLARFAQWYGQEVERDGREYYRAPRAFAEAFDMEGIPKLSEETEGVASDGVWYDEMSVYVPAAGDVSRPVTKPVEDDSDESDDSDDSDGPNEPEREPVSVVEEIYGEHRRQIEDWRKEPESGDYAEVRKYMESGIKSLLEFLTDGYTLWTGTGLNYYVGKRRPFVYRKSSAAPEPYQIVLDLDEFRASTLRNLFRFGIQQVEESSPRSAKEFLRQEGHATHFAGLAEEWRSKLVAEFVSSDEVLYRKAAQKRNFEFDDFVVATYAWLVVLDDPWREITAETLNERYRSSENFEIDQTLNQALSIYPDDTRRRFTDAMETAEYVENILGSRLGVTQNALDVPAVRRHLNRHSPYDVLANLARRPYIENIDNRVRFSTADESKLYEIALRMYKLHNTMEDDVVNRRVDVDEARVLSQLQNVSMSEVEDIHGTLVQSYGDEIPSALRETLDGFVDAVSQEDLEDVVAGARLIGAFDHSDQDRVHRRFAEFKLDNHSVTDYLDELMTDSSESGQERFAPTFQEVSQYYE
ncbi:hypothetical protein [Halorubrum tibetense]|uniref:Uncharacterized protein n=1 Tax=Halorubrum tibetense TaxID=175631 RepID=A0ABD5S6A2_9EURY